MSTIPVSNPLERVSRSARRAIVLRHAQNRMGRALVWCLGFALVVLAIDRLLLGGLWTPWWTLPVLAVAVAAIWAWLIATRHAPSRARSAGELDARLRLSSRLRSAIELADSTNENAIGFIELAMRDADSVAQGLDARSARPQAQTQSWWWSGVLLLAIVSMGLWLPILEQGSPEPKNQQPLRALSGMDSAEEITGEIEQDELSEPVREELSELDSLRQELEQGVSDQREAEARTAAQLEDLAQAMESSSDASREEADRVSETIEAARNKARAEEQEWDPRVEEFAESLREQRFDDAADQIDSLNDSLDQLSPEERERIAQQLEDLANAVDPDPSPTELSDPGREQDSNQNPQTEPETDPAAETETEPETQADESQAPDQQPGQQPEQQTEQESSPETDQQRELSDSLREQAQRVREGQDEGSEDPDPPEHGDEESGDEQPEDNGGDQQSENQGDQRGQEQTEDSSQEQGGEQSQKDGEQEGKQEGDREGQPKNEQGNKQGEQQVEQGSEQRENGQEQQPTQEQQGGEGREQQSEQPEEGDRGPRPSDEQGQEEGQEQGREQGQENREQQNDQQGDQSRDQPSEQQDQRGSDESLERRLRDLDEQQRRARRDQGNAEKLREQARRLTEPQEQPDQSEQSGQRPNEPENENEGNSGRIDDRPDQQPRSRGAGDGERDPNTEPSVPDENESSFVPVDARDQNPSSEGEPVGKWYGDDAEQIEPGSANSTAQRFRRAAEQAQRAVDEQQVPRRYRHLVREVFQRVKERADAMEGGGSVAPQGKDAVPSKPSSSSDS